MFHVLLVDDEPIVKIALRTMIDWDNLGFSICGTASDGAEALALVKELQPDIIITDLKMPNMDGLQLIRELNRLEYKGKIIVASNFGEYELVREALLLGAVDYMLKISIKTEDLIAQLQKTAKLLQEQQLTRQEQETKEQVLQSNLKSVKHSILKDYFTNSYYDIEHLLQHKEIPLYFLNRPCYPFYINLNLDRSKNRGNSSNISISFIENMILDLVESEHDAEIFQAEMDAIVVLISKERLINRKFEPLAFVHRLRSLIQMYMTVEPIIVYSHEITGYIEARQTYLACKDAIHIHFYEQHSIISDKDIALKQDIEFANYVDFSSSLLRYWYEHDDASIQSFLKTFTQQCKEHSIHPLALKSFITKCLDYIPLSDSKVTITNAERFEASKNNVWSCNNPAALLAAAMDAFHCLSLGADASDSPVVKKEIADVITYIEEHYRDKITLEMIADHVNFSENYLCRVFREQTGTSLINYINNVRMNKAADLIMKGHTYIKEIASLVGISDQFYFSRMFKKHFGVTPTDYKAHILQGNQRMHSL